MTIGSERIDIRELIDIREKISVLNKSRRFIFLCYNAFSSKCVYFRALLFKFVLELWQGAGPL